MVRTNTVMGTPTAELMNRDELLADFTSQVVGIVDDLAADLPELVDHLLSMGVPMTGIHLHAGHAGTVTLDPTGTRHGALARIRRTLQSLIYEGEPERARQELDAGHALIGVDVDDAHAEEIAGLLRRHHAHNLIHYGRHTWRRLGSAA